MLRGPCFEGEPLPLHCTQPLVWPAKDTTVPRRIILTHKSRAKFNAVAPRLRAYVQALNPEWPVCFFDDAAVVRYFCGADPPALNLWRRITRGAHRSDFFRYHILFRLGGVYLDSDNVPLLPFDDIVAGLDLVSTLSRYPGDTRLLHVHQGLLASAPGNPVLARLLGQFHRHPNPPAELEAAWSNHTAASDASPFLRLFYGNYTCAVPPCQIKLQVQPYHFYVRSFYLLCSHLARESVRPFAEYRLLGMRSRFLYNEVAPTAVAVDSALSPVMIVGAAKISSCSSWPGVQQAELCFFLQKNLSVPMLPQLRAALVPVLNTSFVHYDPHGRAWRGAEPVNRSEVAPWIHRLGLGEKHQMEALPRPPRKPVVWLHLHKAAGTWICVEAQAQREHLVRPEANCNPSQLQDGPVSMGVQRHRLTCSMRANVYRQQGATWAHIEREVDREELSCRAHFTYGVALRDPESLMASVVTHARFNLTRLLPWLRVQVKPGATTTRPPRWRRPCCGLDLSASERRTCIRECAHAHHGHFSWQHFDNFVVRSLNGFSGYWVPPGMVNRTHFEHAKEVLAAFDIVLRTESLDTDYAQLVGLLGWQRRNESMRAQNARAHGTLSKLVHPRASYRWLQSLNSWDAALFQYGAGVAASRSDAARAALAQQSTHARL